ncbi:DUF6817 domain-containing protein [Massilia sp. Root335]|uniref:DUF6817 domain-containing protein n=1 Tax=Massilia sp. Root335 TaxID=1736517 RepID=UPI0012F628C0|nr:hypothetical protein [Massilia sp. Root335]
MSRHLEEFLYRCGTTDIRHGRRSLAEHLHGTHELLQKWGADEAVCVAGLFHSIYGTNAFRYSALQITHRKRLRALIGDRAERLVFLFHLANRPSSWIEAIYNGGVVSRFDGQFYVLDDFTLSQLIEIECANLIDQKSGEQFLSDLVDEFDVNIMLTSDRVRQGVVSFLCGEYF